MGHFWSTRSEQKATSGHVPRRQRTRAVRDNYVTEDTDTSLQDSETTKATSSQTQSQKEGYGQFCVTLESLLTRSHTEQLATWFGYAPAGIDKINSSDNPSRILVQVMDERGEISPTDISKLTEALRHNTIGLAGVAVKVEEAFINYRPMIDPTTVINAKTEFLRELKQRYANQYEAVQPIPYIRDRLFCVDRVFVEGGIEYFIVNERTRVCEGWGKLNSYKDIFHDVNINSVRRILEGEPGFGKSTLTLQIAYDWCNGIAGSVSDKYEILILLRLKQLGGVKSIFKAIKTFILPKDSSLTESHIQKILKQSRSVLVILDGFDEYPEQDDDRTSDVWRIIKMDMFQVFDVVLTTRAACLPKDPAPQTKRFRLTGFDDRTQDEYIRKAVVGDDDEAAETIKRRLQENPVVADLCQVPLFFVMFAHMSYERGDLEKIKSVTSFFRYMIWCFHHHLRNKMKDENVQRYPMFEDSHYELDRIAFEGLSRKDQQLIWGQEELCEQLGQDLYDHYVRLGILVEETVTDVILTSEPLTVSNFFQEKTEVRFYHKLFCEWYAGNFVASSAAKNNVRFVGSNVLVKVYHRILNRKDVSDILKELDPFDLQYVFRFACGLNPDASEKIIKYLQNKKNAQNFAVLCILEKEGNTETILDSIRALCSGVVNISFRDTLLLQRSTIQLLDVATSRGVIPISCVNLTNCYSTVDLRGSNHLQLKSSLSIPVLTTLNKLMISTHGEGREITSEEFSGILQYSSKCLALNELKFLHCLLPPSFQAESVSVLRSRNTEVLWIPSWSAYYQLNLQSCLWEHISDLNSRRVIGVMTDDDYQKQVRYINRDKRT
ncbi:NLR family CARD domain-containing protein 4 [Holothuria leucospilota]|uniref:NLR family CARD domain-containing protein 4 n=1 Tax=Holothuria leucospilota TaxID=206669 RepID=A0A9Q1CCX9_HOLLE|nr:NLR family CARD domain-containing protein 4 [Holothuria leucospilota]